MPAGTRIFSALAGVVAQPVGGAGVDVDADVGQRAEDVRGVADQLGRELRPTRRAQCERPVRLQHQRHVRGTDPGRELVDPLLVVPLLLGRREATARLLLPRLEAEDRHLHQRLGIARLRVRDVVAHLRGDLVLRDPLPVPLGLGCQRDLREQLLLLALRPLVRRPRLVAGALVDTPRPVRQRVRLRRRPLRPASARAPTGAGVPTADGIAATASAQASTVADSADVRREGSHLMHQAHHPHQPTRRGFASDSSFRTLRGEIAAPDGLRHNGPHAPVAQLDRAAAF